MRYCTKCGNAISDLNTRFCPICGSSVDEDTQDQRTCPRCGEILRSDERYCNRCGLSLVGGERQPVRQYKKTSPLGTFLVAAIILCLAIAGGKAWIYYTEYSNGAYDEGALESHVTQVRNSAPLLHSDTTYGKACTRFFSDRSWEYEHDDTLGDIVVFTGNCMYQNEEATIELGFLLDEDGGGSLEVITLNGEPQNEFFEMGFLAKLFWEDE